MSASSLSDRMARLGKALGEREGEHREAVSEAWRRAQSLRAEVGAALDAFNGAAARAGAAQLAVQLGTTRTDDKHLRAVQFDLARGRSRAVVTVKSRGEITLVGPFHAGKAEGPCKSFPYGADDEIRAALGDFLEKFLAEAASP
ncbi:MAG TPA: hypothetical protein VII78_02385 [Myxococcota bacterium]|jgi:hypothetical protein